MTDVPHSREWSARVARELGGDRHPWNHLLDGPDPEQTFDALLEERLGPGVRVLEAGCGHGPDAARFGRRVARPVAYDRDPGLLDLARRNAPHVEFSLWDGRGEVPGALAGPFDRIVSRRGPTGIIRHLPAVAAPGARFLYVPGVPERLAAVGWVVHGEWRVSVRAWAPTREDWATRGAWMGEEARRGDWGARATARDLAYREERSVVLAGAE